MRVDEAGHDRPRLAVNHLARLIAAAQLRLGPDRDDPSGVDCDGAVFDERPGFVKRDDQPPQDEQVDFHTITAPR